MLVRKLLEIICQDSLRIDDLRCLLQPFELDEQAFAQVSGAYSRRVELLNDMQHVQHFFAGRRDVHPESQVIHDTVNVPAQVSVIVQASDYERRHVMLLFAQIPETQLVHKALRKTLLDGKSVVLRFLVLAVIVYMQLVFRYGIVILDFRQ